MQEYQGHIVKDFAVASEYENARSFETYAISVWPRPVWSKEFLVSFTANNIYLTNYFVPIDVERKRLFLNQTYSSLKNFLPSNVSLEGDQFTLISNADFLKGRYVVIGGPVDGNWWHWLTSWAPRLLLLKRLRPDLYQDEDVRFIVHPLALVGTFRAILDSFGIAEHRLLALDNRREYIFEEATLVSFFDQQKLYPSIMRGFSDHVLRKLGFTSPPSSPIKLFTSRQRHPRARRRIRNFPEFAKILDELKFEVHLMGEQTAYDQVKLFYNAQVVAGVHGADLSGMLFCRPGTKIITFEPQYNIDNGLHLDTDCICMFLDLESIRIPVQQIDEPGFEPTKDMLLFNRDVMLDAATIQKFVEFAK